MRILTAVATTALTVALIAGGCGKVEETGGGEEGTADTSSGSRIDVEAAWLEVLGKRGLRPAQDAVDVAVSGAAPVLTVTITLPESATETAAFADALFGAEAFTLREQGWVRVDTAEIRAEIAPLLEPGQSATVELPVEESGSYRVLVPVAGAAAWGDV